MFTTEQIREMLSKADVMRDPYGVASGAVALLARPEGQAEGLRYYVKALSVLRLPGAAARLTGAAASGPPPGVIAWSSRARRFAANLKSLEQHAPWGKAAAEMIAHAAAELAPYELHQAADGNFQVLDTRVHVINGWVGGLMNHRATAQTFQFDRRTPSLPLPFAFDGVAFGWPLLRVLEQTANSYLSYSAAVYVLESEPIILAMLFHMHDFQAEMASGRTRWFVGGSGSAVLADYQQALAERKHWTLPGQYVRCMVHPRPALELEKVTADLRAERARAQQALQAEIKAYYDARDLAWWRQRFAQATAGEGEPLRVMGITSRYSTVLKHSMAELKAAAEAAGRVSFEIAMEPDDHSLENPMVELLARHKPDVLVQISRMRYENPQLPRNVPFVCWDQDNLAVMRTPEATASLDAFTSVAGHGAVFGYTNLKWPRQNCMFVHAAAATHRYHAAPAPPALLARHACDFSYVSNASGTPEELAKKLRDRYQSEPRAAAFLEELLADIMNQSKQGATWETVALRNAVRSGAKERQIPLNDRLMSELMMDANTFADRAFRQTALMWVSSWCEAHGKTLRLYGSGWENHPTLAKWAAGSVTPGEEARAVFQASKINLQLIQPGFIHSRALDGLAAGGFFLTRYTQADGVGSADIANLYKLAQWVSEQNIGNDNELDAIRDESIRTLVAAVRAYYLRNEVVEPLCPSLHIWAKMPPAALCFLQLDQIVFRNETEFAALAEKYLRDDALRTSLAAQMRQVVEQQFSYGARWNAFVSGIEANLQRAGATGKET